MLKKIPKRLWRGAVKRAATLIAAGVAGFTVLSPEQMAQIEAALIILLGVAIDAFISDGEVS